MEQGERSARAGESREKAYDTLVRDGNISEAKESY